MSVEGGPDIVNDGLVLYLDAGNTKSYPGSGTVWSDLSKNGNDGTLVNGPTFNSDNLGSIVFDGSNDYINLTLLNESFSEVTLSAWFKTGTNHRGAILGWGDLGTSNWGTFEIGPSTGNYNNEYISYVNIGGSATSFTIVARDYETSNSYLLNDNKYHNISVTITSGLDKIYLDSLSVLFSYRVGTASINDFFDNNVTNFRIGNSTYNNGHIPFNGNISQVKIYNRALTSQEILQNYKATKGRYGL